MKKKLVFNSKKWREVGHDVGDNSEFWEEAEIISTYRLYGWPGDSVAVVRFPDGTVSDGHLIEYMKEIPSE